MTTEEYRSAVAQALHYKLSQSTRTDISEQELRDMLDMLTDEELNYLNTYHAKVYEALSPYLDDDTREWLRDACSPLKR